MKILTSYDPKPIPVRAYDWIAYVDGREESGPYGNGETEEKAIEDLNDQLLDENED